MIDMPQDDEVERAVLGCVLMTPELFRRLDVPETAFFSIFHRDIYRVMNDLDADGFPPDLVLVNSRFKAKGTICHAQLAELVSFEPLSSQFDHYVARLKQVAFRREAVRIESECAALAADPEVSPDSLEQIRADRMRQARDTYWPVERGMEPVEGWKRLCGFYQRADELQVVTGYPSLDDVVGDVFPQSVVTVLARPGVGKSVLGLNLAANWLRRPVDWGVMFVSLEMGDTLATDRFVRIIEGWTKRQVREAANAGASPPEYVRLTQDRYCLFHQSRQPLKAIERAVEAWERQHARKIRVVVIDYFQYIAGLSGESAYAKACRLSREVKEFAKVCDCVVVNLCQVTRGEAGGQITKCPTLESARDSGTIEENADVMIGMWKPKPDEQRLFFKGLKVREGIPNQQCELTFDPATMRLSDLDGVR